MKSVLVSGQGGGVERDVAGGSAPSVRALVVRTVKVVLLSSAVIVGEIVPGLAALTNLVCPSLDKVLKVSTASWRL